MYTLPKKLICSMILNKQKIVDLSYIDSKMSPFRFEDIFNAVPKDYEFYNELLNIDYSDINALSHELENGKDIFSRLFILTLICKFYYDKNEIDSLKKCYITSENEFENCAASFILFNFLYSVKSIYNSENRKNVESEMLKCVYLFNDMGLGLSNEEIQGYKNYLESEYMALTKYA